MEDKKMQRLWLRIAAVRHAHWQLPQGKEGERFLRLQTELFRGCREGKWNSERALVFAPCILHKIRGRRFDWKETRAIIAQRMDAWEAGKICTLVKSVESHAQGGSGWLPRRAGPDTTDEGVLNSKARRYGVLIREGQLRSAVRMVTESDNGRIYILDDLDTKTGDPVIDVLRSFKATVPARDQFEEYLEDEESNP
ncbi:LOW QUALITY PROTEIN: hypothetical protein ACHAWF_003589 [Thalassiosira exigua]